jgi:plastocyanin
MNTKIHRVLLTGLSCATALCTTVLCTTVLCTTGAFGQGTASSPTPGPTSSPGQVGPCSGTAANGAAQCASVSIPQGAVGKGSAAYGVNPLDVPVNTQVTWTNNDSVPHTVTADDGSFDSGTLQPGQTFSHTFTSAGKVTYHCAIHGQASMNGSVQVGGGASPTATPAATPAASSSPSTSSSGSSAGTSGSTSGSSYGY